VTARMPRLRQVPKADATAPIVTTMYEWLLEGRDPVATPYFQHAVMSRALRTEFDDREDPVVEMRGPAGTTALSPGPPR